MTHRRKFEDVQEKSELLFLPEKSFLWLIFDPNLSLEDDVRAESYILLPRLNFNVVLKYIPCFEVASWQSATPDQTPRKILPNIKTPGCQGSMSWNFSYSL